MRSACLRPVALVCVATLIVGYFSPEGAAQHSRRTPIVEAVAKARPSVVTIKAQRRGSRESVGTGVLFDERGYVLTCNHVIAGASQLTLRLADGTEFEPRVVLAEAEHDLAVLHIHAGRPLAALPFGPSQDLLVGETVLAVGHPFGYSHTVSDGILSAVDREITMPGDLVLGDLIQTTASINPGNSGGPLLNINGEWIGVNLALREGAQGIAFALKSETAQRVLSRKLSAHYVAGLHHGLECVEALGEERLPRQRVRVNRVTEASPAAAAGLRAGDTILLVADRPVANRLDVERALWTRKVGEKIELTVVRDQLPLRIQLTLQAAAPTAPKVFRAFPGGEHER